MEPGLRNMFRTLSISINILNHSGWFKRGLRNGGTVRLRSLGIGGRVCKDRQQANNVAIAFQRFLWLSLLYLSCPGSRVG